MSLLLIEISLSSDINLVLQQIETVGKSHHTDIVETQVTGDRTHAFVIVDSTEPAVFESALRKTELAVTDVAAVRLVGASLEEIKAAKPAGNFLVEWDLPEGLTMEKYLNRKKEKAPLYEQVPEVSFLRTYVREDMLKCLCFYDGDNEADIQRAREVVSAPIDRLHKIEGVS